MEAKAAECVKQGMSLDYSVLGREDLPIASMTASKFWNSAHNNHTAAARMPRMNVQSSMVRMPWPRKGALNLMSTT